MGTFEIIKKINHFDIHYEMSDSPKTLIKGTNTENALKKSLITLSKEALQHVKSQLTARGESAWERYFSSIG